MHELTIAAHVVEIVENNLRSNNARKASSITLEIGKLSGVVVFALETSLKHLFRNTINSDTELIFSEIAGKARCNSCSTEYAVTEIYDLCPNCNSFDSEIICGEELTVKSIEIEEN